MEQNITRLELEIAEAQDYKQRLLEEMEALKTMILEEKETIKNNEQLMQ